MTRNHLLLVAKVFTFNVVVPYRKDHLGGEERISNNKKKAFLVLAYAAAWQMLSIAHSLIITVYYLNKTKPFSSLQKSTKLKHQSCSTK